ncbi:MAG TPA: FAD-dependent oxidoreductase [Steroidobacteraceae bacterium]|nr:FAD-dependent oxidoreductase [Steroidobacteraceae bacterium]
MVERVRVLVIGGGAVGCSCLYHLTRLGWADAVLVEQNELTSGSTWHAAGNCPTFATSWSLLKLQQYSAALYRQLGDEVDYPINYHVTGSVRLAHTRERMDEYRHVRGMAQANGLPYELLTPAELRERHPFVELDGLLGALWDPYDGDIDPAQLTQALAAGARKRGARIQRFTKVTGLQQQVTGEWRVTTDKGDYLADVVVNAAGYRAGEVMSLLGRSLPIVTMSHQYLVTEDIPEFVERGTQRVPLLRDPDVSYYLRQERSGLILGPYEHQATPMWLEGIPEDFSYKLWDDALERLETYIEAAYKRVPVLASAGIKRVVNGPIPYAPDGLPYLGPAHGLANFFHCNTFSFGITQAGGAGKALAEWVVNGGPEWDLWSIDPRRFTGYATQTYTVAKAIETYQQEYAPAFPYEERPAARPLRTSPLHYRLASIGARFGVRGGWERALWYDADGDSEQALTFRRERSWNKSVAAEVHAVRNTVGLMDLPGFSKFMISGPGAEAYLDRLVCSRLPKLDRISLAYVLNETGGIVSEFTLTRLGPQTFYALSAASAEHHDDDVLTRALPEDGSVHIEHLSERFGTLVLAGPRSRDVLSQVTQADLSNAAFPWLSARRIEIGSTDVLALRVSYTGELGWELHAPTEYLANVYEAVVRAGAPHDLRHFGLYALDSLRIDKCYRGWKGDLESGYSALAASLDRFVDLTKADFVGKSALLAEKARGVSYRLVPLTLDHPGDAEAPYCSSVFSGSEAVGIVTSAVWSFTLERSVMLAYVRRELATAGTRLSVEILGERCPATVGQEPLFDPQNSRPRS